MSKLQDEVIRLTHRLAEVTLGENARLEGLRKRARVDAVHLMIRAVICALPQDEVDTLQSLLDRDRRTEAMLSGTPEAMLSGDEGRQVLLPFDDVK